jgi:hypothetical protein
MRALGQRRRLSLLYAVFTHSASDRHRFFIGAGNNFA